jgi:hypothetical protein
MEQFPGNSQASRRNPISKPEPQKEEEARAEKIISGRLVRRKKPLLSRLKETFIGDNTDGVLTYVAFEIVIPAVKDVIVDVITQGVERTLYGGESRPSSRRSGNRTYTSYNNMSRPTPSNRFNRDEPRSMSRNPRGLHRFDEIILDSRFEGEEVIDALIERLDKYGAASVADLYDFVGVTGDYTDGKYGWKDLRSAKVTRVREGYLLDLPRPEHLD